MHVSSFRASHWLVATCLAVSLQLTACGGEDSNRSSSTARAPAQDTPTDTPTGNAPPTPAAPSDEVNLTWPQAYQRDADYPGTANLPQQLITLRDGIRLAATVTLPADENGNPAVGPFPVIATFTGYNQFLTAAVFADDALVRRGYAYITVDLRGTGASEGSWQAFSQTDHDDIAELIQYIKQQPWSNGKIGMNGISYYAMNRWHAAGLEPPHLAACCIWEGSSNFLPRADPPRRNLFAIFREPLSSRLPPRAARARRTWT